jgi:hypothetical protein
MGRFWRFLLLLVLFSACGGGGCPSTAGGYCDPSKDTCQYGYYCARIGVCTKSCSSTDNCQEQRTCSSAETCLAGEQCVEGVCGETIECLDGYCQAQCAKTSTCSYDPYGPWSRDGDE